MEHFSQNEWHLLPPQMSVQFICFVSNIPIGQALGTTTACHRPRFLQYHTSIRKKPLNPVTVNRCLIFLILHFLPLILPQLLLKFAYLKLGTPALPNSRFTWGVILACEIIFASLACVLVFCGHLCKCSQNAYSSNPK